LTILLSDQKTNQQTGANAFILGTRKTASDVQQQNVCQVRNTPKQKLIYACKPTGFINSFDV